MSDEILTVPRVDLKRVFLRASRAAHHQWTTDLDATDVENELWAWYLERPYVRAMFEEFSYKEAIKYATTQAHNILTEAVKDSYVFSGSVLYSSEAIKDTLKGKGKHKDLVRILPIAMDRLRKRYPEYAEALESRYLQGNVPAQGTPEKYALVRAHRAISEEVDIVQGGELREFDKRKKSEPVDPNTRKGSGSNSDPTATIAIALMDHPEEREAFYESEPLPVTYARISEPSPNPVWNIFDYEFQGMPGLDNYRASVFPELYPNERANYAYESSCREA